MFDSDEEKYFSWWLDELKRAGYISDYSDHTKTFPLADNVVTSVAEQLKTKVRFKDKVLLKAVTYTPDFVIKWENKAHNIFYQQYYTQKKPVPIFLTNCECDQQFSYIDVKPEYQRDQSRTAKFQVLRKWVYQKYKVFVQPIVYQTLFKQTFTPSRYLLTDKTKKPRTIHWKVRSLQEFIKEKGGQNANAGNL